MSKVTTVGFQENFIECMVDEVLRLVDERKVSLDKIAIVFGGKRPALFVKRELSRRLKQSYLSPRFFTIDEFINYSLNKTALAQPVLDLDSCYRLYQMACMHTPALVESRNTFDRFLPWAQEILTFIEQLQLENIDDKALLSIQANAEIGYDVPDDINEMLKAILKLKNAFEDGLKEESVYTRGLKYQHVAQNINNIDYEEFEQIIFCNFFYFNKSEQTIVSHLHQTEKASLIFQGDEDRWPILKRLSAKMGISIKEKEIPKKPKFKLNCHAGFDGHSQIAIVREIIKKAKQLDQTVVMLPDTERVVPLISEISEIAKEFNVSMGYPLKRSSLFTLFQFILKAQSTKKDNRYYAKSYLHTLRHPFIKNFNPGKDPQMTRILIHKVEEVLTGKIKAEISGSTFFTLKEIETEDMIYENAEELLRRMDKDISKEDLKNLLRQIHQLIFSGWDQIENFKSFAACLKSSLDQIIEHSFLAEYPLNITIARRIYSLIDEINSAAFSAETFPKDEMFRIMESRISGEYVAFHGSPLKGMQVLGLFETRSLNFKNVIILDVNEGSLPKLNVYEPLIPREVKISLGIDRLEFEEEIQRYQFMRLISSAENVHLVYKESREDERSRFIEELIWEDEKVNKGTNLIQIHRAGFNVNVKPQKNVIKKTSKMIQHLRQMTYSASSINTYLRDPIEFYYTYVLGLREKEDLLDEPEARHVGTFVHELLEEAFKPYLGHRPEINTQFKDQFRQLFESRFGDQLGKSMKSDGFLLQSVIEERLTRFLDNEENNPLRQINRVMHLEHRFEDSIKLTSGAFKFNYIVDRIDEMRDGTVMILDYKTGSSNQMPKEFEKISRMDLSLDSIINNIRSFQIPLYFHYLVKNYKNKKINAALYNLKTLKLETFLNSKNGVSYREIDQFFLNALDYVLSEITDPKIDFVSIDN